MQEKSTPHILEIKEFENPIQQEVNKLKQTISAFSVFAFIEKFDERFKKKKKILSKGEILFEPGQNPYLYIIISGTLSIIRGTENGGKKEIWRAYAGSFIGEGILFWQDIKTVAASVLTEQATILKLSKEDIAKIEELDPAQAIDFYKNILLRQTNERLLDAGKELADIYELTNILSEKSKDGEDGFYDIMKSIEQTLWVDSILFIETHPFLKDFSSLRYDTKKGSTPISERFQEIPPENMKEYTLSDKTTVIPLELKTGNTIQWYFLMRKKGKTFKDDRVRIAKNIAPVLWAIVSANKQTRDQKYLERKNT